MPMRQKRQPRAAGPAQGRSHRSRARRRLWSRSIALLLPLTLVVVALVAPIGQASSASDGSPEAEALALSAPSRSEAREALRAEREEARKAKRRSKWATGGERANVVIKTSCTQVVWAFRGFPDVPGNEVTLKLKINHVISWSTYSFDGPSSTLTMPIAAPPGHYKIDTRGMWNTNGFKGNFDIGVSAYCLSSPAFSVEKLQQIEGAGGGYTTEQLTGDVGQTVDYEIVVRNTGNVPLGFASLSDARCDAGTITGGPPGGTLAVGASGTYLCKHLLSAADQSAGSVQNTVTLTGSPPEGEGSPVEHTTNTVVATVAPEPPAPEPPGPSPPAVTPSPTSGVAASSTAQTPSSGVLASRQSTLPALKVSVPSLRGPQGCVRSSFRASVKAKGVASVAFYMDGRRLRTLTARSARKGQLSITIDPSRLSVGAHRLMAKIAMKKASPSSKAVHGTRSATVLRCRPAVLTPEFTG